MKKVIYWIFVVFVSLILIASTVVVVAVFLISPDELSDPKANLTEEEYAQLLADENPMALEALSHIQKIKNMPGFVLMHGRIGSCKKISQMLVGREGRYYVKLEYYGLGGEGDIILTYYGKGTGTVSSADLYNSTIVKFRASNNFTGNSMNENEKDNAYERHIEGEDLEILLKYWKGEYNNDGTDNMQ